MNKAEKAGRAAAKFDHPNVKLLTQILASQRGGRGCLPFYLGLSPLDFVLISRNWLAGEVDLFAVDHPRYRAAFQRGQLRQQLLDMRRDEWRELRELLLAHRCGEHALERPLADIVAAGCLGGDHLWRDLGLPSRAELGELMRRNFEPLAARNGRDMKWKKFFYKQLCESQGGYVCRAPSCDDCAAYEDCFGPEE